MFFLFLTLVSLTVMCLPVDLSLIYLDLIEFLRYMYILIVFIHLGKILPLFLPIFLSTTFFLPICGAPIMHVLCG